MMLRFMSNHRGSPCAMEWVLSVLFLILTPRFVDAATLKGIIKDTQTNEPLYGAWVVLGDAIGGVETDAAGRFEFDSVPAGIYTLRVSHVGYHQLVEKGVRVLDRAEGVLQLAMIPRLIPLEEMIVRAEPVGQSDIHRMPSFVTVLKREMFEGRATSVPEVLSTATGVQLKQLGGLGSFSTISVRGSSAEQVEIYLDGILLNSAFGGGVNLSNLPLKQIEQIELYRGAAAEGGGMGGTLHIRTRSAREGWQRNGGVSWGSFDTRNLSTTISDRRGAGDYLLVAEYLTSDNNFRFLDDNGTRYNLDDDSVARRVNSDFTSGSLLGKWRHRFHRNWKFYLQENLYWSHKGIPGISNNQSTHARLNTFRNLVEAGVVIPDLRNRFSIRQRVTFSHTAESFMDPNGEVGLGRQNSRYRTRHIEWQSRIQTAIGQNLGTGLGISIRKETFLPESRLQRRSLFLESDRWTADVRVGTDWELPGRKGIASISAEVRRLRSRVFDENPYLFSPEASDTTTDRTLVSFRWGLRFDLRPGLWLKANLGLSPRVPSFYELFGDRGGVVGNTELIPERGHTWDAGFRAQSRRDAVFEAAFFDHRYEDLIQFVQTSQGTSRAFNIGKARARGVEVTAGVSPVRRWSISGNYTYQRAVDESDIPHRQGNRLPNRPAHRTFLRTDVGVGYVSIFYEYTFQDKNFLDRANLRPVPSRHIHNLGLRVRLSSRARMTLEAKNLKNTRIADVWGYPLPGRSYFVTLQL